MNYEAILYEEREGVALISYNRPEKRNAWNVRTVRETIHAFQRANASDAVGAIVLTGEGTVYCAGADYKGPPEPKDENGWRPNPSTLTMGQGEHNWLELLATSKPNVIALNGPAVGIGATHTLAGDIRIAAESASFGFPFLRLGAMPECGSTGLLPRLVGFGRALDMCLRNRVVGAQEALQVGLVTAVHPDAGLRSAALELAGQLAKLPPLQVKLMKRMFYGNAAEPTSLGILRRENDAFIDLLRVIKKPKPL